MSTSEADIAAQLIERLLGDPAFRAEFRRDPASACRKAGLDELADEMSIGAGKAMMTLDQRESKSSLAGVMMAAAMEGVGVYQFGEHILPHIDDVPSAVGDVLSRVSLPAIDLQGALAGGAGGDDITPEAPPADAGAENGAGEAGAAAAAGGNGGSAAAAPEAPPETATPEEAAAAGEKAAKGAEQAKEAAVPPEQAAAGKAAAKIAAAESPEAKRAEEAQEAVAKIKEEAKDLPDANDLPDGPVAPQPVEEVGKDAGEPAPAAAPPAAAPPAAVEPAGQAVPAADQAQGGSQKIDPSQFGGEGTGTGGTPSPETLALLENKNVILDDVGIADLKAGRIDPRVVAVLTKLSQEHEIKVSCMCSDHSKMTAGGSISNHFYGRGLDIASVDGEIVNPGSAAARELLGEFQELDPDYRPDEVGSPWAISGPGYFTDAAHQDHLHLGFKTEIDPDWKPPADVAAGAPGAPVAAAAAVPGQPVAAAAAAEPKAKPGDSMSFRAVTAEDAAAAKPKKGDSLGFIQAVQPQQPAVAPVASAAAVDPTAVAGVPADLSGVPDAYPGDDAPPEQMAAWMAKQAEARGLPPELPVMASLVESGLKNLNFGHADSVGFFQMRVGIWNQGDYAGFPEKPELQVKWFLDNAETVKKARIAAGEPIDDPNSFGEWIADVERPAEQYRYKYQTKLEEAQGLLEKAPQGNAAAPVAAPPAAVETPGAPPAEPQGRAGSQKIDPSQFGGEGTGTGGEPSPETLALLKNENITFDETGISDLKAGRIDPRVVAVLTKLSQEHELKISCMCSDHSKMTAGGSISNHFYGRGVDIASVDGEIVNPGSAAARELATEMQEIAADYRPDEIGTPWAINGPGYFTDAGHQDHLHLGFKTEIDPDWKPPADVAAGGGAPAAPGAPVAAAPGAPVASAAAAPGQPAAAAAAVAQPKAKPGDSLSFRAVTAQDAAEAAAPKQGDELSFMQPPAGPPQFLAPADAVPAPVADAAAATATGGSGLGASALEIAKKELAAGVKEEGTNTGAKVDEYLAAADVGPGNPWCAAFVTWAMKQSGHEMEGSGWAAVQTWVRAAEAKTNDLEIVSAEDARPGDLVVYDWGGQEDFAADGHIGFLQSNVQDGKFTALEGNYRDAVLSVPRQTTGANVKFIRINGDAPAGAPAPSAPVAPAAPPSGPAVMGALDDGTAQAKAEQAAGTAGGAARSAPSAGAVGAAADAAAPAAGGGGEAGAKALAAIAEAKKYMGTAYKWGGSTPDTGFDCSGLVQWAYAKAGIELPRVTYDQIDKGTDVPIDQLRPGDLVFFGPEDNPWHVGIALGDGKFLHAPKTGDVVKVTELEGYWESEFAGARRIDGSAPVEAAASAPAAAASAAPAAAAPVDPDAVAKAQAAVERDAAEVKKGNTMMFMAVKAQEADRQQRMTVQFMKAVDPKQQVGSPAAAAAAAVAPPEVAAAAGSATGPTAAEDAAANQAVGAPVPEGELALQNVGAIGTYPGDNASQTQLAQWLASEAKKAGLPPELPVMASLVESGVKNLKGGDADSAGFFQMRVGIWDNGPYKGFRMNPQLQAKWFIDNALQVKRARLAAGKSVTDPGSYGEWIADVERPAAQYRYKYQLRLTEARKLLGG